MKDVIRIVLVDPTEDSRDALQRLLGTIGTVWVAEVFDSYEEGSRRLAGIAPDVTIIVLDHDPDRAIELIGSLTRAEPPAIVLPASRASDSALILRAMRAGAREFLTLPAEAAEVPETINRLLRVRPEPSKATDRGPQIISVTGAAGGVGATSIAVNLAATLAADKARETLLLDLDLIFGAVDAHLDIVPDNTLSTVLQNFERLDQTLLKRSMTRHASGLHVLPHPTAIEEAAKIDPEVLGRLLGLLKAAFSTVVIDTSKGLQSSDFVAFEMSDLILVVVQLDVACLRNSARLIGFFREYDGLVDRVKLVVNRTGSTDAEIGLKKAEETLKMPITWQIPDATKIFQPARIQGVPIAEIAKGSRAHQAFLEMARALRPVPEESSAKPRRGLFAAFF